MVCRRSVLERRSVGTLTEIWRRSSPLRRSGSNRRSFLGRRDPRATANRTSRRDAPPPISIPTAAATLRCGLRSVAAVTREQETSPVGLWRFLLALLRWEARLLAYLASLVDQYPPFTLATG